GTVPPGGRGVELARVRPRRQRRGRGLSRPRGGDPVLLAQPLRLLLHLGLASPALLVLLFEHLLDALLLLQVSLLALAGLATLLGHHGLQPLRLGLDLGLLPGVSPRRRRGRRHGPRAGW